MKDRIYKFFNNIDIQIGVIAITLGLVMAFTYNSISQNQIQKDLQDNIIRLHIRGKSNSELDQSFKLYIRDMVLSYIEDNVEDVLSKEDIESYVINNKEDIESYVDSLIEQGGYSYKSQVLFEYEKFPDKTYGFITIPKGIYKSLIINLDKGEGNNWWCVVYPPLCYVETEELNFDDESLETLEKVLDEKTFESITSKNGKIKMDFKLFEIIEKFLNK